MVRVMSNSILRGNKSEDMPDRWLEPENWKQYMRLLEIQRMKSHIPHKCPECHTTLEVDEEQIYCPHCGLITQDSTCYHAGRKFTLPHGLKLM